MLKIYIYFISCSFLCSAFVDAGMPWGKDAALALECELRSSQNQKSHPTALAELGCRLIDFHREVISPADGPRSNFLPSSSGYTFDAMQKYGFFQGIIYGCDRLMRENADPWIYPLTRNAKGEVIKSDPVK